MRSERLIYLPLGGAGEIGMNAYVYGYGAQDAERLIVVDLGVTFPDMDGTPGVDLILPDIAWLAERRDQIDGIFITHAHEDHVGAVAHTYDRLGAPIYARAFTANIARRKMDERGHPADAVTVVSPWPEQVQAAAQDFAVGAHRHLFDPDVGSGLFVCGEVRTHIGAQSVFVQWGCT